jgi:membrane protein DedA with SNARE-associated domain
MSLLQAFLIGQSATLAGSSILYWVGRRGGRPLLFRYGSLLHISAHRLAQVERMILKLGPLAVIIGRQIPGLRLASPLACGVFRLRYRLFVPAMIVGSSVYIGIFILLGMWGGPAVLRFLQSGSAALRFVISSALLVGAGFLMLRLSRRAREVVAPAYRVAASRRKSLEAALLAGLGASTLMALVVAWLLAGIAVVAQTPPDRALLQFLERSSTALPNVAVHVGPQRILLAELIATIPFEVCTHILWAVVYAFGFERRLRGSAGLRGLQFALLPWLFNALVLFPLLGAGFFAAGVGVSGLPALGELIRQAIFGVSLGTLYRLIRLARQPRAHTGHRHGHRHGASIPAQEDGIDDAPAWRTGSLAGEASRTTQGGALAPAGAEARPSSPSR